MLNQEDPGPALQAGQEFADAKPFPQTADMTGRKVLFMYFFRVPSKHLFPGFSRVGLFS